jgi:chromosome segregation ATPase
MLPLCFKNTLQRTGRFALMPSLLFGLYVNHSLQAVEQPKPAQTVQDIEKHIDIQQLTRQFNKAGAQYQAGVSDAAKVSEDLKKLKTELHNTDANTPEGQAKRDALFHQVQASLTERHQAIGEAITSIDAVHAALDESLSMLTSLTPSAENLVNDDQVRRKEQVKRHIEGLIERLKKRKQEGADKGTLRMLASHIKMYQMQMKIEQTILENRQGNNIHTTIASLTQAFTRLQNQLSTARNKAYLVQRQLVAALEQVNGAAQIDQGLAMVESLVDGLANSLGTDNPLNDSLESLENGFADIGVEELLTVLDDRASRVKDKQNEVLQADKDDAYLDSFIDDLTN